MAQFGGAWGTDCYQSWGRFRARTEEQPCFWTTCGRVHRHRDARGQHRADHDAENRPADAPCVAKDHARGAERRVDDRNPVPIQTNHVHLPLLPVHARALSSARIILSRISVGKSAGAYNAAAGASGMAESLSQQPRARIARDLEA